MRTYLLAAALILSICLSAQAKRYVETVFPSSTVTANVTYGQAPAINFPYTNENATSSVSLVMDIYAPTGDTHAQRPAIIFVHSGGFLTGNRNHDDMVALCDSFARKGYVTATIDYRQGFFIFTEVAFRGTRAVYRGIQDGRTAVRYLRANAGSLGIDPNQVYMWGSSAGSFVALHGIYLDDTEVPPEAGAVAYSGGTAPDLGAPDNGTNPGFSGTPDGIVSMWGAVQSVDLVDATDDQPVFLTHGTNDNTVPYTSGPPFSSASFPDVFGSGPIETKLASNGTADFESYILPNRGHEYYGTSNGSWDNGTGPNALWDDLLPRITNFLWRQHRPEADFAEAATNLEVSFTDQSSDSDYALDQWFWDFGDGNTSMLQDPVHTYATDGVYPVELFVRNELQSWDTIRRNVVVNTALPLRWEGPLMAEIDGKDVLLRWTVSEQRETSHFTVEHSLNGLSFRPIGEVVAAGTRVSAVEYFFRHASPATRRHFYRIRQVDFDGTASTGPTVSVELEASLSVFPNPARDRVTVTGLSAETRQLEVITEFGQRIKTVRVAVNGEIDLSDLPKGVYWLKEVGGTNILCVVVD